jgi:phenylacetate-coenzyme A ligase PaaK-like adenylate-forming protein
MVDQKKRPSYEEYIRYFNEKVKDYFPSRSEWTPVDDALFTPDDLFRIPVDQAQQMQLAAIQFSFTHHYRNNEFYRNYCEKHRVSPEDIKTSADLTRIPLIPDVFFKDYPNKKKFATWLGNLFTGELPHIVIQQRQPTYDQVLDAFNAAGLVVTFSSGTGGRHTFIPRDRRTFNNSQYAMAKSIVSMCLGRWIYDSEAYLMMPDPRINSIFAGKVSQILYDIVGTTRVAINQRVPIALLSLAMGNQGGLKGKLVRYAFQYKSRRMIDRVIDWLAGREESKDFTFILGPPYLIHSILQEIKRRGKSFKFGERGGVSTGGGWKIHENERLTVSDFRAEVQEILGIPEKYCLDVYAMVECNGCLITCPEGHYLHVPYSFLKPLVLDETLMPVPTGEWGRFAFLDALALSYPGFIVTGDQVRLLEKCPVCDRPGPVLEPEIKRAAGQDDRGCAGEIRRLFSAT